MPALEASALMSVPYYHTLPVGRAIDGMIATAASFRTAALISATSNVTTVQCHARKAPIVPPARVSASHIASAVFARQVEFGREVGFDVGADVRAESVGINAGGLCAHTAVLAEAEHKLVIEPAVQLHQIELVVIAVNRGA